MHDDKRLQTSWNRDVKIGIIFLNNSEGCIIRFTQFSSTTLRGGGSLRCLFAFDSDMAFSLFLFPLAANGASIL